MEIDRLVASMFACLWAADLAFLDRGMGQLVLRSLFRFIFGFSPVPFVYRWLASSLALLMTRVTLHAWVLTSVV